MASRLFDQALQRRAGSRAQDRAFALQQQGERISREQAEALRQRQRSEQAAAIGQAVGPFGAAAAGELGGLLTSGVPALEQQGAEELGALRRQRQGQEFQEAGQTPIQAAVLASERANLDRINQATAQGFAATALSNARIEGLGATQELALEAAGRQVVASQVKNRSDFQNAIQGNVAIAAGVNGVRRLMQLDATLNDPQSSLLDLIDAAVLMTQIIEPGLATRNDDRMAVETGSSPGLVNLMNAINQFAGGEVDIATGRETIMRTANNLMEPLGAGVEQSLEFWRVQGRNTPGVPAGAVNDILGLDPITLQVLSDLSAPDL